MAGTVLLGAFQVIGLAMEGNIPLTGAANTPTMIPIASGQVMTLGGNMDDIDMELYVEGAAELVQEPRSAVDLAPNR